MSNQKTPYCPIALSIRYVGDKWILLILRDLILHKKTRLKEKKTKAYNDFVQGLQKSIALPSV